MKVQEVLKYLSQYDSNDELLIAWWDKEAYEYISGEDAEQITDEQWKQVVSEVDEIDNAFQDITYLIDEAVKKIKGAN